MGLESALQGNHDVPAPGGAGISLIGPCLAGHCQELPPREPENVAAFVADAGQPGSYRHLLRVAADDDFVVGVEEGEDRPVGVSAQLGKNTFALILQPEAQTQHAECLTVAS